jgi:hypothetical protein
VNNRKDIEEEFIEASHLKRDTMKKQTLTVLIVFGLSIFTMPLKSQPRKDLPELVSQSAVIVRAKVTALSARWITDRNGKHIYTTAQLEPIATFKGTCSPSLTFIGGTFDGVTEFVSDVFVLTLQEEAFFFLPAGVEKFTSGKTTVLKIQEDVIRRDDTSIKAAAVESAIRAMIKAPSLKMKFQDLSNTVPDPALRVPLQNGVKRLGKAASLPDLQPYLFWNSSTYPIIVRSTPATNPVSASETDSSPLNDNDTTLISLSVANYGADAGAFTVKVYIDAQLYWTENINSLAGLYATFPLNRFVASIPSGTHTLMMVIDPDNAITEIDESNNTYSRSITVNHVAGVPSIISISPSTVSAGTGSSVTITGTGFGATQGSGVVEFFYQDGQPKIVGTVSNWTDTQIDCIVPIGDVGGYPAAAGSGPVTVRIGSAVSGGYPVNVTFAYGGVKWSSSSATYKINENYGSLVGEGAAVQAGFATWNNGKANFSFLDGGATSITAASYDGTNAILWGTTSGSLASNYYWASEGTLLESDIVFDNSWTWGIGSGYDIQSIVTHELGHSLNLRDQYGNGDMAEIMYGFGGVDEIKRALTTADRAGIQWIYGSAEVLVKVKVFLQGAYSGTEMTTALYTSGYIPLNSQIAYDTTAYGYTAETVSAIPNANVVDWVLVELRSGTAAGTKVETQPAFLLKDGSIVDMDGVSDVAFGVATAGDYYIVVKHRNHLAIMSAALVTLPNATAHDFTTAQAQAYGTNPMAALIGGVFGMWCGDTDASGSVVAADRSNTWNNRNATGVYDGSDTDLSGTIVAADRSNTWNNRNVLTQVP